MSHVMSEAEGMGLHGVSKVVFISVGLFGFGDVVDGQLRRHVVALQLHKMPLWRYKERA